MQSSNSTFYWFDFETFGADPKRDRPAQFAGIRTDENLNIIGEPLMIYCKPSDDFLPNPQACLITGITPQVCLQEGLPEREFIQTILKEFSQPNTCVVGYNSIRFDDEVVRHTLYRNFLDPYEREYKNGNSRWDILDMVRCAYALRPEGITWPKKEDGSVSFRLEDLTKANGIEHSQAHDAMSDVYATIEIAKLIKTHQPKLFQYLFDLRIKNNVADKMDVLNKKPLVHVSGMFPVEQGCMSMVVPLAWHPVNRNAVICFDLNVDPTPLYELNVQQIQNQVFSKKEELAEQGLTRLPLKMIHTNRCPVVAPGKMVTPEVAERWSLDGNRFRQHLSIIKGQEDITEKLQAVFAEVEHTHSTDVDSMLYNGFFGQTDRSMMRDIVELDQHGISEIQPEFQDQRLPELFFRYKARNFPDCLDGDEHDRWEQHRQNRLLKGQDGYLTFETFAKELQACAHSISNANDQHLLEELHLYAESIYPYH